MYFEVWKNDKLIRRGNKVLSNISFDHELMYVPSFDMTLPIDWIDVFDGWEEVKLFTNGKCFYGLVWDIEQNKVDETITINVRHIISEWEHRQISVNHAQADKNLNVVYKGDDIEVDKDTGETITASDFSISRKALKNMTKAKWIAKASATAWETATGDPVAITEVDADDVKKKEGEYKVIFKTAKGTTIKVDCTVKETVNKGTKKTVKSKANDEAIQATGFTVDKDSGFDAEDVERKIKAKAWKLSDKDTSVPVTTYDTSEFRNEVGVYNVSAATAKGTRVTVKVEVEDGTGYGDIEPAIVDKLEDIYSNMEFAYPGWQIEIHGDAGDEMIDYVYSKQNKLEALTQTMQLTDNLFWRVGWLTYKKVEIGEFGEIKPYTISTKPSGKTNIRIIEEPVIDYDFENVINVATVYSDKSDSGMVSLTLREAYNDLTLLERGIIDKRIQKDGFPVIILRGDVNNERDYSQYLAPNQPPALAPNNELEYAVLDIESIATESGRLLEGSFAFNDLNPFNNYEESKRVTDKRRAKAAKAVYKASIRNLKQNRRSINIQLKVEEIPADLLPGDKVRFIYDNSIWNIEACSSYYRKLLEENDYFYVTHIGYEIDENEVETNTITLSKWIKIERETQAR